MHSKPQPEAKASVFPQARRGRLSAWVQRVPMWVRRVGVPVVLALSTAGCAGTVHGFLAPAGLVATDQRSLLIEVTLITLIVVVPVLVLTPWLVWRFRRRADNSAEYDPRWEFSWTMEILAWGVPILIVIALSWLLWVRTHQLDPYRPIASSTKPLQVDVVGLDWKWLFIYPAQHTASVNELVIPTDRPVHLTLTSDTVMQSLLIPKLAGQIYAMPGMRTQLYLEANHAGQFRGENTQYNGRGFQQQKFSTIAMPAAAFTRWQQQARSSGKRLDCAAYAALAKPSLNVQPTAYRDVDPQLFRWILTKYHGGPAPSCHTFTRENDR
jgi:Heme/copper-type cytochrome/quinol oxidases, subunit 2